jgi:macrolide-specific efflux system membrane fusion protein
MKRFWKWLIVLLVIAGAGGGGYKWYSEAYARDPLADVITTEAVRGDIELAVLATGSLRPVKLVAVGAQASGRVTALNVDVGKRVKQGDLIAEIDSLTQQNALQSATAALANMRAQLDEKQATLAYSKGALSRAKETFDRAASSKDAYEASKLTVSTGEAQVAALAAQIVEAEVAVKTAELNLSYTKVTAPIDGTVLLITTQQGQTVNASQSAPTIVVLGQIDHMTVRAEISEADVTKVKPGQSVYFTVLGDPTKKWEATLAAVDPAPDTLRSDSEIATSSTSSSSSSTSTSEAIYYYGRFDVPNPDGLLKTYMTAEVHIVLGAAKNAVLVPSSALSIDSKDGSAIVDVVDAKGVIAHRKVEIGLDDKVNTEIRSGLEAGEKIVASRRTAGFTKSFTMRPPMGM